jgi:hypothetical protein
VNCSTAGLCAWQGRRAGAAGGWAQEGAAGLQQGAVRRRPAISARVLLRPGRAPEGDQLVGRLEEGLVVPLVEEEHHALAGQVERERVAELGGARRIAR